MASDKTMREEIEDILVDTYGEDEALSSWGVTFEDEVEVPFPATLLETAVEVSGFRISDTNVIQCLVARPGGEGKVRWIAVEDLDTDGLPDDTAHVLALYQAWSRGDY
jgi:hypothetical protein